MSIGYVGLDDDNEEGGTGVYPLGADLQLGELLFGFHSVFGNGGYTIHSIALTAKGNFLCGVETMDGWEYPSGIYLVGADASVLWSNTSFGDARGMGLTISREERIAVYDDVSISTISSTGASEGLLYTIDTFHELEEVTFSPEGDRLLIAANKTDIDGTGYCEVIDAVTGSRVWKRNFDDFGAKLWMQPVKVHLTSDRAYVAGNNKVFGLNAETGGLVGSHEVEGMNSSFDYFTGVTTDSSGNVLFGVFNGPAE